MTAKKKAATTAAKFGVGKTLLIGGAIVAGAMAIKAMTGGASEGGAIGPMTLGGQDDPFSDDAGMLPFDYGVNDLQEYQEPEVMAQLDAIGADELGTGSNSEILYDPNDNPFPQAGGQVDTAGDLSRFTVYPSAQDSQQASFLDTNPVVGWSLIGGSLIPSWFSSKAAKYGDDIAIAIKPSLKASKAAETASDFVPFGKRAMSFLDRKLVKSGGEELGEAAAKVGVKTIAKKGIVTGAKYGVKAIPFVGLAAGIAIDKASGINTGQAVVRNVVGDVFGGVAGGVGSVVGPVGTFSGAVGGQVGGELATDAFFNLFKKKDTGRILTEEEKRNMKSGMGLDLRSGLFMSETNSMILSSVFRPSSRSANTNTVNVQQAAQRLAVANASRQASNNYSADAQRALSGPKISAVGKYTPVIRTSTDVKVQSSSKYVGSKYSSGGRSSSPSKAVSKPKSTGGTSTDRKVSSSPKYTGSKYTSGGY